MKKATHSREVPSQALGDQVYDLIKNDIILCKLAPGEEVTEVRLAERYEFGRAPVRAALAKLCQEGLVSVVPRRGYVVAPITIKAVQEIFDLRLMLEPQAAGAAVGRVDVEKLRSLNAYPTSSDSGRQNLRFLKRNRDFHKAIFNACGNERLIRTLSALYDEMDRLLHLGLFSEQDTTVMRVNHEEQGRQHDAIIDALAAGNAAAAIEATSRHIEDSRALALKAIVNGRLSFSL